MRKKILINASIYTGKQDGLGTYCEQVYKQLSSFNEFEIDFYSFARFSDSPGSKEISYGAIQKLISLARPSFYRLIWNILVLPVHSRKYDLVYSLSPHGGLLVKNQIVTVHDLIGINHKTGLFQRVYYKFFLPVILKNCIRVVTISSTTKDVLTDVYGNNFSKKVNTIYNGVDHLSNMTVSKPEVRIFESYDLVVGASYPHKNLHRLIEVYKSELQSHNLIIVCHENDYTFSLKQLVTEQNLKNILFLHSLPKEELGWLYQNADIHLYLTLEEGFGLPPFEAALYGTISLISDIPSLKEIYADCLPTANPENKKDIIRMIKNPGEKSKFLEMLTRRSDKFLWKNFRENWMDLIRSLTS